MGRNEKSVPQSNKLWKYILRGIIMIFVTVGTHEQQFDRLIKAVDKLVEDKVITEEVIIQTGYSTYEPKYCKWSKLLPYKDVVKNVEQARIVITHGGPSSFIMPLQIGKTPIVVPRQKKYDEHVNDHQLDFALEVEKRQKNIIVVQNIEDLKETIIKYDFLISDCSSGLSDNNSVFNDNLEAMVKEFIDD